MENADISKKKILFSVYINQNDLNHPLLAWKEMNPFSIFSLIFFIKIFRNQTEKRVTIMFIT